MTKIQNFKMFIDGEWIESSSGKKIETLNPETNEVWATVPEANEKDVDKAVKAAQNAFDNSWSKLHPKERAKFLKNIGHQLRENAEHLGKIETVDTGKLFKEIKTQATYIAEYYDYYAGLADKVEGTVVPIDKPDMHVFTRRMPIGVVAAVVPWNAQLFLSATKLGPALAAGCSVILKASEIAPIPMLEFAKLIDQAGFPDGVVSVITGDADNCSIPLTRHPHVDRIAFTGGPETAQHVVRNSAENFAVTTLELGGKSPILVFQDADLDSAANGLIAANFGASGQSCVAGSRGLVHRSILPDLISRITDKARGIVVGDPLDSATHVGPLCTHAQIDRIVDTLDKAQSQGATIHFGGAPLERDGNYMTPTLVECASEDTETLHIEMFGPVMSLIPFDTEEEAISMANNSLFGLGSGVFTQNIARAHRVSDRIRSGICWVNTYRAISPIAPFGGFNQSGYGREAGQEAILDYTRTKTTWINTSDAPMQNPFVMR